MGIACTPFVTAMPLDILGLPCGRGTSPGSISNDHPLYSCIRRDGCGQRVAASKYLLEHSNIAAGERQEPSPAPRAKLQSATRAQSLPDALSGTRVTLAVRTTILPKRDGCARVAPPISWRMLCTPQAYLSPPPPTWPPRAVSSRRTHQ